MIRYQKDFCNNFISLDMFKSVDYYINYFQSNNIQQHIIHNMRFWWWEKLYLY